MGVLGVKPEMANVCVDQKTKHVAYESLPRGFNRIARLGSRHPFRQSHVIDICAGAETNSLGASHSQFLGHHFRLICNCNLLGIPNGPDLAVHSGLGGCTRPRGSPSLPRKARYSTRIGRPTRPLLDQPARIFVSTKNGPQHTVHFLLGVKSSDSCTMSWPYVSNLQ